MARVEALLGVLLALAPQAAATEPAEEARCRMSPYRASIDIPPAEVVWLETEEFAGACEPVLEEDWTRIPAGAESLFLYLDGPAGSGRFWDVTVGFAAAGARAPSRGFCFTTSTVGWRTLWRFPRTPLPWIEDLDRDGRPELVIWSSFELREGAPMSDYGLVAWVYRRASPDRFAVDWALSRDLASQIASAYRSPLEEAPDWVVERRLQAAVDLEAFAARRCSIGSGSGPEP